MTTQPRRPRRLEDLGSIHDLLEEIRLRPSMWVRGASLYHLESLLIGYLAAMAVHGIEEDCPLSPPSQGPFANWLWQRNGCSSSLGWAAEIEREAQEADSSAMELFFHLYDQYRRERRTPEG